MRFHRKPTVEQLLAGYKVSYQNSRQAYFALFGGHLLGEPCLKEARDWLWQDMKKIEQQVAELLKTKTAREFLMEAEAVE